MQDPERQSFALTPGTAAGETAVPTADGAGVVRPATPPAAAPAGAAEAPDRPAAPTPANDPPVTLVEVARRRQAEMLEQLARAHRMDEELVHDLRVSSRRMSEVVRVIRRCMDKLAGKAVEASLKGLRRAAGDLRDRDVLLEHLHKWRLPRGLHPLRRELLDLLPARRPELVEALQQQCGSTSLASAMTLLARVIDDPRHHAAVVEDRLQNELAGQLRKRRKQFDAALGKACLGQTPDALHAARIAAKKLRYLYEMSDDAGHDAGAKPVLRFLKKLQKQLGHMHDVEVLLAALAEHVRSRTSRPPRGERAAWRGFLNRTHQEQARAAAGFFALSYLWKNKVV